MSTLVNNLCYLLWKAKVPRESWPNNLSLWLGCDEGRAREYLLGKDLSDYELCKIAERWNIDPVDLRYHDLVDEDSSIDVLKENLKRLTNNMPHGNKKDLAFNLGVQDFTLSRWLSGDYRPTRKNQQKLKEILNLPSDIDLTSEPLFVEFEPIGSNEKRRWLHQRIDSLDGESLEEIFTALRKLLE